MYVFDLCVVSLSLFLLLVLPPMVHKEDVFIY